ncbi:F-box/WD repeat-containing protein 9-like [Argonauta hians]
MTNGLDPDPDLDPDPESSDPTLTLTLDNLPYELLLLVFRYVDAGHLIKSVAQVCSKFRLLLSSETYWKTRLTAWYSPDRYPPVSDVSTDFDWESSCVSTEQCYSLWHNLSHNTEKISAGEVVSHFSDSLHIMQDCQTVVIGSRDHSLTVLNISDIDSHKPASCKDAVVFSDCKQHKGWIWCLHSHGTQLCSGCWDSKIRLWDTDPNISLVSTFKCTSPILDIVMEQNVIVAATHNHKVTTVDVREGHMEYLKLHRMPVLCMAVTDRYFITGSEDCTLCIYDRCAAAVFKKIKLDYYPLCINYSNHHLWVGDHSGHLMLFDASNDQFNLVKSYELGSLQCKLTAIRHSPGAVFTSYNERQKGKVSIMEPTTGLQTIATIEPDFGEIAALDHCNNTLAYVGSNDCLDIYRPKQPL